MNEKEKQVEAQKRKILRFFPKAEVEHMGPEHLLAILEVIERGLESVKRDKIGRYVLYKNRVQSIYLKTHRADAPSYSSNVDWCREQNVKMGLFCQEKGIEPIVPYPDPVESGWERTKAEMAECFEREWRRRRRYNKNLREGRVPATSLRQQKNAWMEVCD
jgi:hypothetical protein